MKGRKDDQGKPRWALLPVEPIEEVVKVLTIGAEKYEDFNWQKVPRARMRYISAAFRHFTAWIKGEKNDRETGLSHLAHSMCCLIFLMWFDKEGK